MPIKPIDFLTFSASPSSDQTAVRRGEGGGWRLSGDITVRNPPVGFPGLVGRGGLDTATQLYGQTFIFFTNESGVMY